MSEISICTPVVYRDKAETLSQSMLEGVSNYLCLSGQTAYVLSGTTKDGREQVVFSQAEGSCCLVTLGKIISYATIIIPLIMFLASCILHSMHTFHVIDPKKEIEEGMDLSDDTLSKIQSLIGAITSGKDNDDIEWLANGNNLVFKLKDDPQHVFKLAQGSKLCKNRFEDPNTQIEHRFDSMIKAKEICLVNQLGLLIIPHAKKFTVDNHELIVEESLEFNSNESMQEEYYHTYSRSLDETARQLATFVAKTGFSDVAWRNIPILEEEDGFAGSRRIGLIDIEHMESAEDGFAGSVNGSRGLVRCLFSEEQIDMAIAEARKEGVECSRWSRLASIKSRRVQELKSDEALRAFYEQHNIETGKEPITVDIDELGLDLMEEAKISLIFIEYEEEMFASDNGKVSMRKAVEDVVAYINKKIEESSEDASIKGKRSVLLNTNNIDAICQYARRIVIDAAQGDTGDTTSWLDRIIAALVDKGYLFKLDKVNGHGYYIQA